MIISTFFSDHMHLSKSQTTKDSLMHYFILKKRQSKTLYELGSNFFGKYASGHSDLSSTYKQSSKRSSMQKTIIDSGPLIALFDKSDRTTMRVFYHL